METAPFTLRTRRGAASPAVAEVAVVPAPTRWARAAGIVVVGTLIGAATILVPMVHMVSVWGLPLLSLFVARHVLLLRGHVRSLRGSCPACAGEVSLGEQGALSDEPIWVLCPSCREPLAAAPGQP